MEEKLFDNPDYKRGYEDATKLVLGQVYFGMSWRYHDKEMEAVMLKYFKEEFGVDPYQILEEKMAKVMGE